MRTRITNIAALIFMLAASGLTVYAAAPANDNLAGAEVIVSNTVTGDNSEATKEVLEPNHALNVGGKSIWYKYTATINGYLTVTTELAGFDTTLAVYRGSSYQFLQQIAASDDISPSNNRSQITIATSAGIAYYIVVDGHYANGVVASGPVALTLTTGLVASNDAFADAITLSSSGSLSVSNVNATKEPGEPNHAGDVGGHSLWYKFVGPVGGTKSYTFSTRGSTTQGGTNGLSTLIAVYTGASVNALTEIVSVSIRGQVTFIPSPGVTYHIAIDGKSETNPVHSSGTIALEYGVTRNTMAADFDGDEKSDIAVFRPSTGTWHMLDSITGNVRSLNWGLATDIPIAADLDVDGKADQLAFRPETGIWYLNRSRIQSTSAIPWGVNGDVPQIYREGNYSYLTVYRPSDGTWYIRNIFGLIITRFGLAGDTPVMADYDGDGITDIAVYRSSTGTWYRINSSNSQVIITRFGLAGDKPVMGDYDNDGRADIAVYRPSTGVWYVLRSFSGLITTTQWGVSEDIPQPGDYDGDNRADFAVFRPSQGVWYIHRSSNGSARIVRFGLPGDKPVTTTNRVQ